MFYSGFADEAGTPIADQIRAHKAIGWKSIEVRNTDSGNLAEVDDAAFEKVMAAMNEAGMKISSFGSGIANWSRKIDQDFARDVADLKRAIPRMHKAGCPIIRIMSWPNAEAAPLSEADWKKEALRRMKELVKIAEEGGVVLGHENCSGWGGHSPDTVRQLIDEIKSPAFGLIYDTGNPGMEGQDPWAMYQASKPRIVYVHIKDNVRHEGKNKHVWAGDGQCKVREVLKDLFASGYDGCLSIEPHMGSQVHLGTNAEAFTNSFDIYVEYGRRFERLVNEVKGKK